MEPDPEAVRRALEAIDAAPDYADAEGEPTRREYAVMFWGDELVPAARAWLAQQDGETSE